MNRLAKYFSIFFVLGGVFSPRLTQATIMMAPDLNHPCSESCNSDDCLQTCMMELAVRGGLCEPEVLFHPDSGIFCGRECPANRVHCSRGDGHGHFVWDRSFTDSVERVEYQFDPNSKTFGNFSVLMRDGLRLEMFADFLPDENAFLLCEVGREDSCEKLDLDPKTGLYHARRRHGGEREPARIYRILAIPLQWEGYFPYVSLGELSDFIGEEFIPHVEESSCGAIDIEFEIANWIELDPETATFSQILDGAASDPDIDMMDFNALLVMYPREGRPEVLPAPSGCCVSRVFTLSTDDGTGSFGYMDMLDSLDDGTLGRLYENFVRAQGVLHYAKALDCGEAVEDCFEEDPDSGGCFQDDDLWEGMWEPRNPDIPYSAIVREKLGWAEVYDLVNPSVAGGNFTIHSLENCPAVAGISVHLDDTHEYILDYSETINEDPFIANYDPAPGALFGYTEGPINSYRPLSQFNVMSKIGVRKVLDVNNRALLLDMAPDSLGIDFLDALLPVGSSYERCARTEAESGIFIYPYYTVGPDIKIYIGPGDAGAPPEMFLTSESMTELTLPPSCVPLFVPPLATINAHISDDTAVMRADLWKVHYDEMGSLYYDDEIGEGIRLFGGYHFLWLISPTDLDEGENLLRIVAQDIFLTDGGSTLDFSFDVNRYRPEFVFVGASPQTVTIPDSTIWFVVWLEENPYIDRVELYKNSLPSDCETSSDGFDGGPSGGTSSSCFSLYDPQFLGEMSTLGGDDSFWYFSVIDGATDLGPGNFSLFARAYDVCGEMVESDPVMVHVMESSP